MSRVETIRKLAGAAAIFLFLLLIPHFIFPLYFGPDSSGFYRIKVGRIPQDFSVSLNALLLVGSIIFSMASICSLVYFYFRLKFQKKDAVLYRLPDETE